MSVHRIVSRVARLSSVLIVAGALVSTGSGEASASTCVSWAGTPPVNPSTANNSLSGVAVLSPCNVWAVGYDQGSSAQTLAEHWNGLSWTALPSASPGGSAGDSVLTSVAATSATTAWAVGSYYNGTADQTLIETLRGTVWEQVSSPDPGGAANENSLSSVSAISAGNAWAVGEYSIGTTFRTLIERWNGTRWSHVTSPSPNGNDDVLLGVTATSAKNAWAVGYSSPNGDLLQTLIEHWNGQKWQRVPSPDPGGPANTNLLLGVAASSASNVWAVGAYYHNGPSQALIEHWNGRSWKSVPAPSLGSAAGSLTSVTVLSTGDAWAVGSYLGHKTLAEHWNGARWSRVPSPNPGSYGQLSGVSGSGPNTVWTVGTYNTGGPDLTLAVHCC